MENLSPSGDKDVIENFELPPTTTSSWAPIFRQMFVCSGVTSYFFIYGLFFGAPTVFIPQIRKESNSTEAISMDTVSWLYSSSSYGSLPWAFVCPLIAEKYGRKMPYALLWINTLICVSLYYFSTNVTEILISGFLQGMLPTVQIAVSIMVLTEYTSPQFRGVFLTFKAATFYWGVWIANAIGTFSHWKNISILIFICCIYNISIIFWPESPVWLASKGRFEECAKSHRWLKGQDKDSEKELKQLIFTQQEKLKRRQEFKRENYKNRFIKLVNSIKTKRFYAPLIYSVLTICLYHFSGKMVCTSYVIDIIKTISVSESTAYEGMLILDGVTVLGMYVGVLLTKLLKRRTLILGAACIGVSFLFILSIYLYLVHLNVMSRNKYLTLFLLTGFSVSISCGPIIMSMCISGEITPLKNRSLYLGLFTLLNNAVAGIVLKIFPYIFYYFLAHGSFLFYATMSSMFIFILYKKLPETSGKTILEIEKYFSDDETLLQNDIDNLNQEGTNKKILLEIHD